MSSQNTTHTDEMPPNSSLSFVAPAQPVVEGSRIIEITPTERLVPAGLKALYDECLRVYPDQPNPLQVTTRLKYWLGGQDPLDYISMYWNPGKCEDNIPPHWHYISFGLSDLHGDGRVHPPPDRVLLSSPTPPPSGYGIELTFRLAAEAGTSPPLWPAALLQALARYVFTTGNKLCAGDHISWHSALGGVAQSRVRHLLVSRDAALAQVNTPHGTVDLLQMVGCTSRELKAAQRGSGFEVLDVMKEDPHCGGSWLVTRANRRRSARAVPRGAAPAPAHLAGVSAQLRWQAIPGGTEEPASPSSLPESVQQQIKDTLQRGLTTMSTDRNNEGDMSTDSFEMSSIERALPDLPEMMQNSWRNEETVEYLDGVHLTINAEGASLLPLAVDGRVLQGRHFTWRDTNKAVTVLGEGVSSALASPNAPYAARGGWLQIYIPQELAKEMSTQVSKLSNLTDTDSETDSDEECDRDGSPIVLPLTLTWPKYRLNITVVHDNQILML